MEWSSSDQFVKRIVNDDTSVKTELTLIQALDSITSGQDEKHTINAIVSLSRAASAGDFNRFSFEYAPLAQSLVDIVSKFSNSIPILFSTFRLIGNLICYEELAPTFISKGIIDFSISYISVSDNPTVTLEAYRVISNCIKYAATQGIQIPSVEILNSLLDRHNFSPSFDEEALIQSILHARYFDLNPELVSIVIELADEIHDNLFSPKIPELCLTLIRKDPSTLIAINQKGLYGELVDDIEYSNGNSSYRCNCLKFITEAMRIQTMMLPMNQILDLLHHGNNLIIPAVYNLMSVLLEIGYTDIIPFCKQCSLMKVTLIKFPNSSFASKISMLKFLLSLVSTNDAELLEQGINILQLVDLIGEEEELCEILNSILEKLIQFAMSTGREGAFQQLISGLDECTEFLPVLQVFNPK